MRRTLLALLTVFATAGQVVAATVPVPKTAAGSHRVAFAFHSAFLMNLHHFLYNMAVNKEKLAAVEWQSAPAPDELVSLNKAIGFYRAHYAALGIREDPAMVRIKQALSVEDGRRDVTGLGLQPALAGVLGEVGPIYARTIWPLHDKTNQIWIARVNKLDMAFGAEIHAGIEGHLEGRFPRSPVRTDVVFDTGSRQGAYTDEQIVIPSGRVSYQDLASLEMLYHEASHTSVTEPLEAAIDARLKATGRGDGDDLWHVVQFYTVGEVTRDVLARHGEAGYRPYADKRELYSGYWAPYMPVITTIWRDHMTGKIKLQAAVQQMVDGLPRQ